jgi:ERCC4-related helicase
VDRAFRDRSVVRLDVSDRRRRLAFFAPFDRPTAVGSRPARPARRQQWSARLAGLIGRTVGATEIGALLDARLDLLPYQLEPALAVAAGYRRVLVADEVGLGKTIQAGLVLAELMRRTPAARALVIAPAGLAGQWQRELRDRFDVAANLGDRHILDQSTRAAFAGDNGWSRAQVWILSIDFLKQIHVFESLPLVPWDLLIVDEAHDACGDSRRHDVCAELARRSRRVVLLTATPHGGDDTRFNRLRQLGAFRDVDDPLVIFRRTRADVGYRGSRRVRWRTVAMTPTQRQVLDALTTFERVVMARAGVSREPAARLLLAVFRKRALSTMAALLKSVQRRQAWLDGGGAADLDWLQPRLAFDDGELVEHEDDDCRGLTGEVGLPIATERIWLRRLATLAAAAARRDPKIGAVLAAIRRTSEPVVVFTEFRHTLEALAAAIGQARLSILHGGQTAAERHRQLDAFLEGTTTILIATDVAGQGLNLQTRARWMVSFELPWNPARLEQRIGRVDRIGQPKRVHATMLVTGHPAEAGLLRTIARRTLSARQALGPTLLANLALPSEHEIASALLARAADVPCGSMATVAVDTRWTRRARASARVTSARRTFARCWRPADPASVTGWTRGPVLRRPLVPRGHGLVVLSVPLVDGWGHELERRIVAAGVPWSGWSRGRAPDVAAAIAKIIAPVLARRAAILQRRLTMVRERAAPREQAMFRHLHAMARPEEVQAQLFEQTAVRRFEDGRTRAADLRAADDAAPAAEIVRRGDAVIELLIDPAR